MAKGERRALQTVYKKLKMEYRDNIFYTIWEQKKNIYASM